MIGCDSREAPMKASGTCLALLHELLGAQSLLLSQATGFVADLGPGSFTGVKVGVTLAKSFAYLYSCPCSGVESFDLIQPGGGAAIPSKRHEYLVRSSSGEITIIVESEMSVDIPGYGAFFEQPTYPDCARLADQFTSLAWVRPEVLVPRYYLEPSISTPKKPLGRVGG